MMHDRYHVRIEPDGEVIFNGIDWESRPITVWHRTEEHIVFKIPAGKHWESILNPSVSHPGRYLVCEITELAPARSEAERDLGRERLTVRGLFEMPLSSRGKVST